MRLLLYRLLGFGLFLLALSGCASTEITVHFNIEVDDLEHSFPMAVMVLRNFDTREYDLPEKLNNYEIRTKWFYESEPIYNSIRKILIDDNRYHYVSIERGMKNPTPITLNVGKERESSKIFIVALFEDEDKSSHSLPIKKNKAFTAIISGTEVSLSQKTR